ncbi:MAG: cobalamin-dependent protein [Cyclobacteriaceae bacterium]|nr:cobalamin-dependent protein [Cyclobacteriaceae bacterium]
MTTLDAHEIINKSDELAKYITKLHFEQHPELMQRYGAAGKVRCYEDAVFHLNFLAESLTMNLPDMYANYILWAAAMLQARNIPENDLQDNLNFVQHAIHEIMGSELSAVTKDYIAIAKAKLKDNKIENSSYITDSNPLKKELIAYLDYLLQGKRREATLLINELIQQGVSVKDIYEFIFQISQYEVGRLWQCNKITVAHEHYCTAATQQIMSGLYPHIFSTKRKGKTLVACSISGELHELGIRMVSDFFEMDGWDTYYLGANMPDNQLQESLKEYKADVLALSVTLSTHVSKAAALIKKIRERSDFTGLKIMVGGYPFITNPELWKRVAADAFAQNADQAITRANELLKE